MKEELHAFLALVLVRLGAVRGRLLRFSGGAQVLAGTSPGLAAPSAGERAVHPPLALPPRASCCSFCSP